MTRLFPLAVAPMLLLAACAGGLESAGPPPERFRLVESADVSARDAAEVTLARRVVARLDAAPAGRAGPGRSVEAAQLPLLSRAPIGQRFLGAPTPRALALGDPPQTCPAAAVAAGPPGATRADVAASALSMCLDALAEGGRRPPCGCRALAVDDIILAPVESFAYAPGVAARLIGVGRFGGRPLVAEEAESPDGDGVRIALYDAGGPVAVGDLSDDGGARLLLLDDGAIFVGRREPRGWRRGRIQERLLLEASDGRRLIALIGFEAQDVATEAAALGEWPSG